MSSLYGRTSYNVLMTTAVLGLDIGGANLKAAHTDGTARSVAFPLWKHPDRLAAELATLCEAMPAHDCLAVTMTGELCDCFATRRDGVQAILRSVQAVATAPLRVWTIDGLFVGVEEASADLRCAAANWLALAHLVARRFAAERLLLIDTGSTTTDIVYLNRGIPEPRGLTDIQRLQTGELVYTGVRRTPICAVLGMAVAAEFFATMQDAYVFLGRLPEDAADRDTADGRPLTRTAAHARLARLRCADVETFPATEVESLAGSAVIAQQAEVARAARLVLSGRSHIDRVIVAGSGEVVGKAVAEQLGRPATSLADLVGPALSEAACAFAVATLCSPP